MTHQWGLDTCQAPPYPKLGFSRLGKRRKVSSNAVTRFCLCFWVLFAGLCVRMMDLVVEEEMLSVAMKMMVAGDMVAEKNSRLSVDGGDGGVVERMEEKASRFDEGEELASGLAITAASRRHGPTKVVQHGCGWCGGAMNVDDKVYRLEKQPMAQSVNAAREEAEDDDPLSILTSRLNKLRKGPVELLWELRTFGLKCHVPLYINFDDAFEIIGGEKMLNIACIQLWCMKMKAELKSLIQTVVTRTRGQQLEIIYPKWFNTTSSLSNAVIKTIRED
ncbi:hypothetical protein LR48_Vigan10g073600 [Vigna angularis]|uniref:Uncharacterized protein n=1 Tax=Phaseolus angularis TaxID=3914 RepID=A0A0L9VJD6_PHAAN|nr:hypothetical protein LR48_Vigan10g073600 [Vigna angularis]